MKQFGDKLLNFIVSSILIISTVVSIIWVIKYSGISWMPDKMVDSLINTLLDTTRKWGPLFAPAAVCIFMLKTFQKNISYEVCATLEPKINNMVTQAFRSIPSEQVDKKIAEKTLLGIRSVYRGFAPDDDETKRDIWEMYTRSANDFQHSSGFRDLDIPLYL